MRAVQFDSVRPSVPKVLLAFCATAVASSSAALIFLALARRHRPKFPAVFHLDVVATFVLYYKYSHVYVEGGKTSLSYHVTIIDST